MDRAIGAHVIAAHTYKKSRILSWTPSQCGSPAPDPRQTASLVPSTPHAGVMVLAVALRCLGNDACSFQPSCLAIILTGTSENLTLRGG